MCRPCALHPRQSLIALNVCRAWRLWWRDIPWRLLRWMFFKHTQELTQELFFRCGLYCVVLFCKKFTSVLSVFNDRCICLSLWQQVHASISRITATRSEMPQGRDGTWTWLHGYCRIQQLFTYYQHTDVLNSRFLLPASQYLSPSPNWGQIEKQLLAQPDPDPQLGPLEDG